MKKHHSAKNNSFRYAVLFGIITSAVSFLALSFLASALILLTRDPSRWIKPMFLTVFLVSAAIFGYVGIKRNGEYGIYPNILASVTVVGLLVLLSLIMGGGKTSLANLLSYLSYILVSVFFSFVGKIQRRKRRRRG